VVVVVVVVVVWRGCTHRLPEPSGGRFNRGNSKNMVEWQIYLKSQMPGPKYYPKVSWDRGGTFSNAHPLSALDWEIYRSRSVRVGVLRCAVHCTGCVADQLLCCAWNDDTDPKPSCVSCSKVSASLHTAMASLRFLLWVLVVFFALESCKDMDRVVVWFTLVLTHCFWCVASHPSGCHSHLEDGSPQRTRKATSTGRFTAPSRWVFIAAVLLGVR